MPFIKQILNDSISSFADSKSNLFINNPVDTNDNAAKWADALQNYAANVFPPSTTVAVAKAAFLLSMKTLSPPYLEKEFQLPFTVGFVAHEAKFNLFNNYIKLRSGYKSNPKLDTLETQAVLKKIQLAYNLANPSLAITDDIIRYCQALANELYGDKIIAGKDNRLLQVDGIIGDETIKISFTDSYNVAQQISKDADTRNQTIAQFRKVYDKQVFFQPISWGQVAVDYYEFYGAIFFRGTASNRMNALSGGHFSLVGLPFFVTSLTAKGESAPMCMRGQFFT